jgi:hypothetical protein
MEIMKIVKVISKQPNVKVKKSGKVSFKYNFETEPVEMPVDHADIICQNPSFVKVKGSEKETLKYDFNNDGVFDDEDVSIAAKAMAKSRNNKNKSKGDNK